MVLHISRATKADIAVGQEVEQAGITYRVVGSVNAFNTDAIIIDLVPVTGGNMYFRSVCNGGSWGQIRWEGRGLA